MWPLVFAWLLLQIGGALANLALNERISDEVQREMLPGHSRIPFEAIRLHRRMYPASNVRAKWIAVAVFEMAVMLTAVVYVVARWR
jgi:hypothetical protein